MICCWLTSALTLTTLGPESNRYSKLRQARFAGYAPTVIPPELSDKEDKKEYQQ